MLLRIVVTLAALVPSVAAAQAWSVQSGVAARGEYNDNYFLTPTNQQSAFTASVSPFVTAARRTETTDVTALLAVGLNRVWGPSPTTDYVSGRLGLNGVVNDERSTWTGGISFVRAPLLQSAQTQTGVALVRADSDAATVNGTYTYALTERWSVGATAGWYWNSYDAVERKRKYAIRQPRLLRRCYPGLPILGANPAYGRSDFFALRERYHAKRCRDDDARDRARVFAAANRVGVGRRFLERHRDDADRTRVPNRRRFCATPASCSRCRSPAVSEGATAVRCTAVGSAMPFRNALGSPLPSSQSLAAWQHRHCYEDQSCLGLDSRTSFSERLTGRLGVGYTQTKFPAGLSGSFANEYYLGEIGASFRLAERWILDAGYRYARADYADNPSQPTSNVVFVSIAYNWPGTSFTDWVGTRVDMGSQPGAGPISLPERKPAPYDRRTSLGATGELAVRCFPDPVRFNRGFERL